MAEATPSLESQLERLSRRLSDLPEPAIGGIRLGFSKLSALDAQKRSEIVNAILKQLGEEVSPRPSEIAESLGLAVPDVADMALAVSVAFGVLVDLDVTPSDFVSAVSERFLDDRSRPAASELAQLIVAQRVQLKEAIEDSSLANTVLPSITSIGVEVDLRLRFGESQLERSVPVAVVHIDTDCENQEIWFQLKRAEIERLIRKLEVARRQMDLAARLVHTPGPA
jgi:hypothetical protein